MLRLLFGRRCLAELGDEIILSFNPVSNSMNSELVLDGWRHWCETVEGIEILRRRHLKIALLVVALVLVLLTFANLSWL